MTEATQTKKYESLMQCEACGEPLKLIRIEEDDWLASCSDARCAALHKGSF